MSRDDDDPRARARKDADDGNDTIWLQSAARVLDDAGITGGGLPYTAERLRILAERLGHEEQDVMERLAKAGEAAAEAQRLAVQLRVQLRDAMAAGEKSAATADHYKRMANDATRLSGEVTLQLTKERESLRTALRTIALLLDAVQNTPSGDGGTDVRFQFTQEPGGISPEQASDIALALGATDNDTCG